VIIAAKDEAAEIGECIAFLQRKIGRRNGTA